MLHIELYLDIAEVSPNTRVVQSYAEIIHATSKWITFNTVFL